MRHTIAGLVLALVPITAEAQTLPWEFGIYHEQAFNKSAGSISTHRAVDYGQGYAAWSDKDGGWMFISADTIHKGVYLSSAFGYWRDFSGKLPVEFGLAGGFQSEHLDEETTATDLRFASTIRFGSLDDNSHFVDFYYESGRNPDVPRWASRFNAGWYQANAAVSKGRVLLGLISQTDIGHGVRFRYTSSLHKGTDLRVWTAPMIYQDDTRKWQKHLVIGGELIFSGGDK